MRVVVAAKYGMMTWCNNVTTINVNLIMPLGTGPPLRLQAN